MRVKLFNYQNFRDLDFVFVYLDNILISSGTEEEHGAHLWFGQEPVFLWWSWIPWPSTPMVSAHHPSTWRELPPQTKDDIWRFLGILIFFQGFIPAAAQLLQLTDLQKKSAQYCWDGKQKEAIKTKQRRPSSTPSHCLNPEHCKFSTYNRELLACLQGNTVNWVHRGLVSIQVLLNGSVRSSLPNNLWPRDAVHLLILAETMQEFCKQAPHHASLPP